MTQYSVTSLHLLLNYSLDKQEQIEDVNSSRTVHIEHSSDNESRKSKTVQPTGSERKLYVD